MVESIKDTFQCPTKVVLHWDGKVLIVPGNIVSNRVVMYIDIEKFKKLPVCSGNWIGRGRSCHESFGKVNSQEGPGR